MSNQEQAPKPEKKFYNFSIEHTDQGMNTHFTSGEDQQGDSIEVLDAIMIMHALKTMLSEGGVNDEQMNHLLESMKETEETLEPEEAPEFPEES